jgi:hypothetical protein
VSFFGADECPDNLRRERCFRCYSAVPPLFPRCFPAVYRDLFSGQM